MRDGPRAHASLPPKWHLDLLMFVMQSNPMCFDGRRQKVFVKFAYEYVAGLFGVQMLPGFLLVFSADESGRILYVSNNVSDELGHTAVSCICFCDSRRKTTGCI